jgi:alpha-tubulin suppressor-like RCC1 family protein
VNVQVNPAKITNNFAPPANAILFSTSIAAGDSHSAGVDQSGRVWAWGSNFSGETNPEQTVPNPTPQAQLVPPTNPFTNIAMVAAGNNVTCTVDRQRVMQCWGANGSGQLGRLATPREPPGPVGVVRDVQAVALGGSHTCVIASGPQDLAGAHAVYCWGNNRSGQVTGAVSSNPETATRVNFPKTPPP